MYFSVTSDSAEFGDKNNSIDVKIWGATTGAYMLWDSSTDDLKFGGGAGVDLAGTTGLTISGTITSALTINGTHTNYIDFGSVGTAGTSIALHFVDAFLGKVIETGTYQSTADGGVILTSTNTRPVTFLADDSGSNIGGNVRNVLSRVLLTADQSAGSIRSLMGQMKLISGVDLTTGVYAPVQGYFEFVANNDIQTGAKAAGIDASIEVADGATLTVDASGRLAGVHCELTAGDGGSATVTQTGDCAAVWIDTAGTITDWKEGVHIANYTNGVVFGSTTTGRCLVMGTKASASTSLPITSTGGFESEPGNNYMLGLFTAVAADHTNHLDELRGAWIRTRVNDGCDIGNVASTPSGFGVCGAEIQLKFYATAASTDTRGWQNSALWAQLETQGASTVSFNDGSLSSAVFANVGLTSTTVIDSGAIVAGVAINSTSSATGGHVTTTGDFVGMYIGKSSTALAFETAIMIIGTSAGTILSAGTSGVPNTTATASVKHISIYTETTATSGASRGLYLNHKADGAGTTTGEAIRGRLLCSAAVGSMTGVSGGFEFDSGGAISGSATGMSGSMVLNSGGQSTGGLYGISACMHFLGTGGVPTHHAILEIRAAGNATGADKCLNAISFCSTGTNSGSSGYMIYNHDSTGATESNGSIRILVDEGSGKVARHLRYWDSENA